MFWNCNEGDILEETLTSAISKVGSLFIADDGSTDNSWEIIQSFAAKNKDKVEYIRNKRDVHNDQGQRQALLKEIKKRYKGEETWVQIIESDIMILDPSIREAIDEFAMHDIAVSWQTINAARKPGTWKEADTYPNWSKPITEIMPYGHWMEVMLYTFRPLPKIHYNLDRWRPWPQGFDNYVKNKPVTEYKRFLMAPLLAHYGFRGPTHYYLKCKKAGKAGKNHNKYKSWDLRSPETVDKTVSFFNGEWNGPSSLFPMGRKGWIGWRKG